jgi:hypothetical protein
MKENVDVKEIVYHNSQLFDDVQSLTTMLNKLSNEFYSNSSSIILVR